MRQKIKNFIVKLQNSNEKTKKRWLIGLSAAAMFLIVMLWIVYLDFISDRIGRPEQEAPSEISFWQVLKVGIERAVDSIKSSL